MLCLELMGLQNYEYICLVDNESTVNTEMNAQENQGAPRRRQYTFIHGHRRPRVKRDKSKSKVRRNQNERETNAVTEAMKSDKPSFHFYLNYPSL